MFLKLLAISIVFVGLALSGLGLGILLKPGGKFPETHVGRNKEMRKLGIKCSRHVDTGCVPCGNGRICSSC
ncbi:MAG TPA: hypothetical protein PLM01_04400 [Bacteroidales bacterium]|jgi:hypothetical protein|nr:hypothetical protein [Bacteroidales bacterium]HQJ81730.1 hypothetical protein [Bacteroidales bacterium]